MFCQKMIKITFPRDVDTTIRRVSMRRRIWHHRKITKILKSIDFSNFSFWQKLKMMMIIMIMGVNVSRQVIDRSIDDTQKSMCEAHCH